MLTTTATIATTAIESDTTNNTTSVTSIVCDMAGSTKQVQAQHVMPGDVLTYTITISPARRSGGGMDTREVTLTDTLPFSHQVRFLGWNGTPPGTAIDGHMLRWQGQVRAGQPLTLVLSPLREDADRYLDRAPRYVDGVAAALNNVQAVPEYTFRIEAET